jgi:hypothetical protein
LGSGKELRWLRLSPRGRFMAGKSKGTWYVSFELPPGKRAHARATATFPEAINAV